MPPGRGDRQLLAGLDLAGRDRTCQVQRDPTAKRRSGSSVLTPITTSPRIPCGRPIRPTMTRTEPQRASLTSSRSMRIAAPGQGADHGTQRPGSTSAAADDLAEVVGMHPHLEDAATAQRPGGHVHSSGYWTMPRTRCSRASSSTSGSAGRLGLRSLGLRADVGGLRSVRLGRRGVGLGGCGLRRGGLRLGSYGGLRLGSYGGLRLGSYGGLRLGQPRRPPARQLRRRRWSRQRRWPRGPPARQLRRRRWSRQRRWPRGPPARPLRHRS